MGRMTRAKAADLAEKLHVDEDAVLEMPEHDENAIAKLETPKKDERPPLGEIAPNSGSGHEDEVADLKKSTKGRKTGRKAAKGRKKDLAASANVQTEVEGEEEKPIVEDAAQEVSNEEPSDEPVDGDAQAAAGITEAWQPEKTPSQETLPVRMTRSQIAQEQQAPQETNEEAEDEDVPKSVEQPSLHIDIQQAEETSPAPAPASPLATATPKVIASLRKDNTGMRSTSNKENEGPLEASIPMPARDASLTPSRSTSNYDALEAAVVEAATPPIVSRRASAAEVQAVESQPVEASLRVEDVGALLAEQSADTPIEFPAQAGQKAPVPTNEEASTEVRTVESPPVEATPEAVTVDAQCPEQPVDTPIESPRTQISQEAPVSTKQDAQPSQTTSDPAVATDVLRDALEQAASEASTAGAPAEKPKTKTKKPAPVVRTMKASAARMSLAQGDKAGTANAPSSARPRPSTARQSTVMKPAAEKSQRVPSTGTQKPAPEKNEKSVQPKKEATIPHSKPRPVNLSFPTPPPPPKSKKAPTTSTFQLPGEAVAAKLKAAREERMKKEASQPEEKKPATFKARPAPALKKPPSVVRPTTSTKARESMVNGKPPVSAAPPAGLERASTVQAPSTKPTSTTRPRTAVPPPPRTTAKPEDKSLKVAKRPTSTTNAAGPPNPSRSSSLTNRTSSAPRASIASRPGPSTTTTSSAPAAPATGSIAPQQQQRVLSKGTAKGKEVFTRALLAKEALEREKREKEEAARRARESAAERGRIASREWAEKQRLRKLGAGGGKSVAAATAAKAQATATAKANGQETEGLEREVGSAGVVVQGGEEVVVPAVDVEAKEVVV
ncbi:hypothetical protein D0869_08746 [Hortaea werneckii]|uniref:Uncharacterized protein n=1 Tax=Hortaea werneckii TaxID=91943 RepID=A0A3M6WKR8_HORWE|nr:hypothetical protein KC324_g8085 [Hortaea werneckii]KAI7580929.1 hypothetical protein KC316_g8730 [Hortaea werneckii]RMX78860.1 hypothetical protein D0869_08746 [Hortaea werneckii]RMX88083.1 hypothetical protein D0868_14876 [Hortaea werneckii]